MVNNWILATFNATKKHRENYAHRAAWHQLSMPWLNVFFSPLIPCKIIGSAAPHPIVISYGIKPHTWSGMIQNGIMPDDMLRRAGTSVLLKIFVKLLKLLGVTKTFIIFAP